MSRCDGELTIYGLICDLFLASAITCFLWAMQRASKGVMLRARVKAFDELVDEYTPQEREELIHRIKTESLSY